jgi:hypothetical protein
LHWAIAPLGSRSSADAVAAAARLGAAAGLAFAAVAGEERENILPILCMKVGFAAGAAAALGAALAGAAFATFGAAFAALAAFGALATAAGLAVLQAALLAFPAFEQS